MKRRYFLKASAQVGASLFFCSSPFFGCKRDRKMKLRNNVEETEQIVKKHPIAYGKLAKYFEEIRSRLKSSCSTKWISYQNNRLNRIRWLVDKNDDGKKANLKLRMRPYDIPWVVVGIGDVANNRAGYKDSYNGWFENVQKIMACPGMEIEFTEEFADFCYLCSYMTADGCAKHDFGGYGKEFPQPRQMNDQLKQDCDQALSYLGLKWDDMVTAEKLLLLCVEKAPDPSSLPVSDFRNEKLWPRYKAGIEGIKSRGKKQ